MPYEESFVYFKVNASVESDFDKELNQVDLITTDEDFARRVVRLLLDVGYTSIDLHDFTCSEELELCRY